MQRLAATSQQAAGETADSEVIQPLEIEVVYEPFDHEQHYEEDMVRRMLEEFRDEEWKQLAKVCAKSAWTAYVVCLLTCWYTCVYPWHSQLPFYCFEL